MLNFKSLRLAVTKLQGVNNMNRKELIDAMAAKTDCTKACADRSIGGLIDIVTATLKKGEDVALVGFGTFKVPQTGAELKIKAAKVAAFKPGATVKAAVSGGKK